MEKGFTKTCMVGDKFNSKSFGEYEVTELLPEYRIRIRFTQTGYETIIPCGSIATGMIRDPLHKNVQGVACFGEGCHVAKIDGKHTPAYKTWHDIIRRCYDPKNSHYCSYGGRGVHVCEEWLNFQNFATWYDKNYIEGFKLDKDLTIVGSKIYSPETCTFVPDYINIFVNKAQVSKHGHPQGVNKIDGKYIARLGTKEGRQYLGYYETAEEAFAVYKKAKEAHIREIAQQYYDRNEISETIYNNLLSWEIKPYAD